ncbi:MAG: AAA family ATPase, partial [Acetobacteraceae bacterium]|nr:AAA family ATPase [Acetobacteraceae bacterium]
GEWLTSLGLEQYARHFIENSVDLSVVRDLTEKDLQELGVLLGHRRKILRAIAELPRPSAASYGPAAKALRKEAERRRLTVMFCDLVGSAALAARLDPEDMREVIRAYNGCIAEVIGRHEGTVVRYLGDGALAYFGYPRAHEDDAERAVRAALALVEAVAALPTRTGDPARARVGVATGTVVIGNVADEDPANRGTIIGETPNLAQRLQAIAEAGSVVISSGTRRLTGGLFDYRDLGCVTLKGWSEPVPAWQVLGPSAIASRFEALRNKPPIPPLGRDEEIERLLRRWRYAVQGEGRAVLLTGEPGIGKSHLALELERRLADERHFSVRCFCSAHHTNSVLFPVIGHLAMAARLERADSATKRRAKLKALIARAGIVGEESFALLADLLSLPPDPQQGIARLPPQKQKERTVAALLAQLEGLAASRPVLVIFEDLQWIDPTSLELLALAVERIPPLRVLLMMTARPEFVPPWPGHAHVTTIPLTRLSRSDGAALVERVTAGKALPPEVMKQILARTDGIPLFIEELTKTVLESDWLRERGSDYVLGGALPPLAIPATLDASLMARLDRLASVREVAQIGAVIGREFSYELLSAVAGLPRDKLEEALFQLVRSGLVFCRGEIPDAVYTFKHTLVRDAAYAQLLKGRLSQIHAAIAEAIEKGLGEIADGQPELLAHHLSEAGLVARAIPYWLRAGQRAATRFANLEAVAHLERGIDAMERLPPGSAKDRLELDLHLTLGPCLIAARGHASRECVASFIRSRELCERLGDVAEYPQVISWLVSASIMRAELAEAQQGAATLVDLAEARGNRPAFLSAARAEAMILLFTGRLPQANEMAERAIKAFETSDEETKLAARTAGQDAGAAILALDSWILWALGHIDRSVGRMNASLRRAESIQHPHTSAYVAHYASLLHILRGEPDAGLGHAERCLALADEHGFAQFAALARAERAICQSASDPLLQTLRDAMRMLDEWFGSGMQLGITVLVCPTLLNCGQATQALDFIERAIAAIERNGERLFEAELCRFKARALLLCNAQGALTGAEDLLRRALATARGQEARSLELRAAIDMAALFADQGRREEACGVLAPVYQWFTEGSETGDLRNARELLERL